MRFWDCLLDKDCGRFLSWEFKYVLCPGSLAVGMVPKSSVEEEVEVPRAEEFVEVLAGAVVVGFSDDGLFILEFLKPLTRLVADKEGRIKGFKGEMQSCARIYISYVTAKKLLRTLEEQIRKYEDRFKELGV